MTDATKPAKPEGLDVRPDPDGVIRLRAVARAKLELGLDPDEKLGPPAKAVLRVALRGTSTGLPDKTPCQVTCRAPNRSKEKDARPREFTLPATICVPGWKAGSKALTCTLVVDLPIVSAALFGQGTFDLVVLPGVPHAAEASVKGIPFDHPFEVTPSRADAPTLSVGETIWLTPKISTQAFVGCPVRVQINEHDARETGGNAEDLSVVLAWTPADQEPRRWRVGCNAAGALDYAERNEQDPLYDFWWVVRAAQGPDGAWVDVSPPTSLCKTPRPELKRLALDRDATHVRVVGEIGPVSADLHARVRARLWCHRPFGTGGKLRIMSPLPFGADGFLDAKGELQLDLAPLGPLAESARGALLTAPGVELFGVLQLVGWSDEALPLSAAMKYAPTKHLPFGHGDLPHPGPKQRAVDVAVAVCTEGVVGVDLVYQPDLLGIEARLEGERVVVRAHLAGGDATYWRDAKARIEVQAADDPAWVDLGAKVTADGEWLEATVHMADKRLLDKEVLFQASVREAEARLRGCEVQAPEAVATTSRLVCKPALLPVQARWTAPGTLQVAAATRYLPRMTPARTLAVELFEPLVGAKDPRKVHKATVKYANPANKQGMCDRDGRLVATITGLSADATTAWKGGSLQVRVFGSPLGVALSEAAPVPAV